MKKDVFHNRFRVLTNLDHITKKGDTLNNIAERYEISLSDLINVNDQFSLFIAPNQIIVIPRNGEGKTFYFEEYKIMPNDNILLITKKTNTKQDLLMKFNDFTKLSLSENQVLRLPRKRSLYQIKEGDNLEIILRKHGLTYEALIRDNLENWLRPGNSIIIN